MRPQILNSNYAILVILVGRRNGRPRLLAESGRHSASPICMAGPSATVRMKPRAFAQDDRVVGCERQKQKLDKDSSLVSDDEAATKMGNPNPRYPQPVSARGLPHYSQFFVNMRSAGEWRRQRWTLGHRFRWPTACHDVPRRWNGSPRAQYPCLPAWL